MLYKVELEPHDHTYANNKRELVSLEEHSDLCWNEDKELNRKLMSKSKDIGIR